MRTHVSGEDPSVGYAPRVNPCICARTLVFNDFHFRHCLAQEKSLLLSQFLSSPPHQNKLREDVSE